MNILFFIVGLIVFLVLYIRYLEKTTVFYPDRNIEQDPSSIGLEFEEVMVTTSDGQVLYPWWIPKANATQTLLFFHGNAGNISHRLEKISFFHEMGVNIFIVDYRGFGKSTGSPTEKGVFMDAQAAYDYLTQQKNISAQSIVVYGASLGGAISIDLVSKNEVAGLITDSTFTSAVDMAKLMFPWAPSALLSVKFDSIGKIQNIHVPKLMFHSTDDATIPYALGQKLYDVAPEPKTFVTTVGGHNDEHIVSRELLEENVLTFLNTLKSHHE